MTGAVIFVLLVEDNRGDARLVQEALTGSVNPAFRVEHVTQLSSCLARLSEGCIDVVLLDLGLPDSQGLGALVPIRRVSPGVPVVVLSGTDDEQFAVDAVQAGAQDYLVKNPAVRGILKRSLRYAIERKRAEELLRASEERLSLATSTAKEAIWEYLPSSGFSRWNDLYSQMFDTPVQFDAGWWNGHIHPDERAAVSATFRQAVTGTAKSWEAEYQFRRSDGSWANVHDRALIARNASGSAIRVVGAMLDVTERTIAAKALESSNRRLRQLSRDLLRSQDYERRRIARELHDSTAQLLCALNMSLVLLRDSPMDAGMRAQGLDEAIELAAECSTEIRTVTYLLHPPLLDQVGLSSALQAYVKGFARRTGIHIEVDIQPDAGRFPSEVESSIFRIVQEGLANVHRHSGSLQAGIRLERDLTEVRLVLWDRGRGLPSHLRPGGEGFVSFGVGILGMRERAEQLGGRLELTSNDEGTILTVTLPLVQRNEENTNPVGG
ncbi:MAG: response regulator [Candidatus Solibacter sp.]